MIMERYVRWSRVWHTRENNWIESYPSKTAQLNRKPTVA